MAVHGPDPHGARASAASFLRARLRLRRREAWRALGAGIVARVLLLSPAWAPITLLALFGDRPLRGVELVLFMLVLGPFAVILVTGLVLVVMLPEALRDTGRELIFTLRLTALRAWEPALAELVARQGRVPATWLDARVGRRWAARTLQTVDAGLVDDGAGLRLVGDAPVDCPDCGGELASIGPCLRRCAHCARERYDAPPPVSPGFAALRDRHQGSFRARLGAEHPEFRRHLRATAQAYGGYVVGMGGFAALSPGLGAPDWLAVPFAVVGGLAPFAMLLPGSAAGYAVIRTAQVHWATAARYRYELRDELVRAVRDAGAISFDDLATRLDVAPAALEAHVARLIATGELPLAVDHAERRLVSRFCPRTSLRCAGCGGALRPEPRGLACRHCDVVALAIAAAPAPDDAAAPAPAPA